MEATLPGTSTGTYRVLASTRDTDEWVLVDRTEYEPTAVQATGYAGDLAERVDALRPGYVVDATLDWGGDGTPAFADVTITDTTLFAFADGVTGLFEVALDTWAEARRERLGVNSTTTYGNDGEPNGALYTFSEQPGERDVFAEFRDGTLPLDPLVERIEDDGPHEVFVLRPAAHPFVLVYVVRRKGSLLADTVRDTYDCPRPDEPAESSGSSPAP